MSSLQNLTDELIYNTFRISAAGPCCHFLSSFQNLLSMDMFRAVVYTSG